MKQGKGHGIILAILFITLFSILPLVNAEPPVTTVQQFTEGFVIAGAPTQFIKQNTDYTYNFFLYNISNGLNIGVNSTKCFFYLADSQGTLKYSGVPTFANNYYSITISKGNFSTAGHYPYGVNCNSSTMGGALVDYFEVTPGGETNSLTTFYFLFILLIYGFVVFGVWKEDITITMLGTFGLYFVGLYIMFYGIDIYKNLFTQALSIITLAVAGYLSIKMGLESMN